jgi:hypothetical protein
MQIKRGRSSRENTNEIEAEAFIGRTDEIDGYGSAAAELVLLTD